MKVRPKKPWRRVLWHLGGWSGVIGLIATMNWIIGQCDLWCNNLIGWYVLGNLMASAFLVIMLYDLFRGEWK